MKFVPGIAILLALAPGLVLAAPNEAASKDASAPASTPSSKPKDCSTIKSTTVRQACLDREAAEHPVQAQTESMTDAVDDLKREDDLLARNRKGICRGC